MMLPSISQPNHITVNDQNHLFRRKGGGGKGGGGSKGGKSGSKSGSSSSSVAKKNGASDAFVKSRGSKSFTVTGTSSSAFAYSSGGGKRITLSSSSTFSGREAGGGNRGSIYGTSRFGSGYPYGGTGYYVDNRPFPYYFYPVPCYHHYYGGDEYLNASDRPGGNLVTAIVHPSYNTSVTYRLVGDNSSVVSVFDALVVNCSVANSSSAFSSYTPSNTTWPLPEQVVQYYRASSFALSLDGYNNTAALPSNMPATNTSTPVQMADTSLPSGLNMTFLSCINSTIAASVPLVQPAKSGLSSGQIAQIVGASIAGAIILPCLFFCLYKRVKRALKDRKKKKKNARDLDDFVPNITVVGSNDLHSPPPYKAGYTKDVFDKAGDKSRPVSVDERTLVADSSSRKERWSYASSSASSRSDVSDTVEDHSSKKVPDQQGLSDVPESGSKETSWMPAIPFPARFGYKSVKHQSTSSIELPLTDSRHSYEAGLGRGRGESTSLSPSHSPYASRSPSPSPTTPRFPLIHAEEKR